jgi:hypothetical protein
MSSSDDSSPDPELLEVVNQYRTAVKTEENTYDERLNKESQEFAAMWYAAFPEQLNEPAYLAQQKKLKEKKELKKRHLRKSLSSTKSNT